jgi:hypothetical protein
MWVHYFTPETKWPSMIWLQRGSLPPKKFKTQLSAGTITASVFWDSELVIHFDLLSRSVTINAQYYSNLFFNDVHQAVQKRRSGKLSKQIILMHDVCSYTANLIRATLAIMHCKTMNLPPYSPDYIPNDFHLFGPVKVHIGQKFQTDDELNAVTLTGDTIRKKRFMLLGLVTS